VKEDRRINKRLLFFGTGFKNGIPIGLGYFAVAFSLGIAARDFGLSAGQGFIASLFTIASAGQYIGFTMIGEHATLLALAVAIMITNSRYLLMSFSLRQRISPDTSAPHRIGMSLFITDEIFGSSIAQEGYVSPYYMYGAAAASVPLWAIGTSLGIIFGNIMPPGVVSALSVSLYGMFIAIIIPPAKKSKAVALVITICFLVSYICSKVPVLSSINSGLRILLLTILIGGLAALVLPVEDKE